MLKGTIEIQSELGKGTEVFVRLPLARVPNAETPASTPSSALTEQAQENSTFRLSEEYGTTKIALYGFDADLQPIGQTVRRYIEDWYGLKTIMGLPGLGSENADLVILDERALPMYLERRAIERPVLVFCGTHTIRPGTISHLSAPNIVEYASKPFGPQKLAKGIYECLKRNAPAGSGLQSTSSMSSNALEPEQEPQIPDLKPMVLETDYSKGLLEVQTNEIVTAMGTDNAQRALGSNVSSEVTSTSGHNTITEQEEYPFPVPKDDEQAKGDENSRPDRKERPQLVERATDPLVQRLPLVLDEGIPPIEVAANSRYQTARNIATAKNVLLSNENVKVANLPISKILLSESDRLSETSNPEKRPPRLLLVDDNKINLRLLETFMKKRNYETVDSAENGQLAVEAATSLDHGYDIIFMDISMPVMNGFEATRLIREVEEETVLRKGSEETFTPALIIALTGLASGRDQTEAFTSGVDVFMTKPVSFKEVGRLLDNWEQHGNPSQDEESGVA